MRVLEQGPDRQRAPEACSGGVSSMVWSLPVGDVLSIIPPFAGGKLLFSGRHRL
jgi:Na+-transporting NADH:ubiquinone oxidoreductase subunit NqrF